MISQEKQSQLEQLAGRIRWGIIRTGYLAGTNGAHFGGCLSIAEILAVLYDSILHFSPEDIENRDRFILSKGHAALALYSVLFEKGFLSEEALRTFEKNGSDLAAHAKRDLSKGLEFSGGSLSLGLSYAVGVAYSCKHKGLSNKVFALIGDGELNEGLVWESLLFAAHQPLDNFTIIVDHNHLQADGTTEEVLNTAPLSDKLSAFGFEVQIANGHSVTELYSAFSKTGNSKPIAIIAETIKGKGISFMENKAKWHHGFLNEARFNKAAKELDMTIETN